MYGNKVIDVIFVGWCDIRKLVRIEEEINILISNSEH
jgi:hypothetical protein